MRTNYGPREVRSETSQNNGFRAHLQLAWHIQLRAMRSKCLSFANTVAFNNCCCWFIHPATAISRNRNGSRTRGMLTHIIPSFSTATSFRTLRVQIPERGRSLRRALGVSSAIVNANIVKEFWPDVRRRLLKSRESPVPLVAKRQVPFEPM